jgi:DNA primase
MDKKERAKQVKIQTLYEGDLKQLGSQKLGGLCPFHNDSDKKNANFIIYLNTNTYYCFVCAKGGDSITFYMRLHNVDFKKAINDLCRK